MLSEKISQDVKAAIKEGDNFRVGILRMMIAVFKNKEIEKRGKGEKSELSDEEIIEILSKEIKKRKEAAGMYSDAGRKDLADKELSEVLIIQNYLPVQASFEEVEKIINGIIERIGVITKKDFGRIMGEAMKELKGKAESSLIAELIKKELNNE